MIIEKNIVEYETPTGWDVRSYMRIVRKLKLQFTQLNAMYYALFGHKVKTSDQYGRVRFRPVYIQHTKVARIDRFVDTVLVFGSV